ncbi:MAG: response regulator [Planctomycetes bacterium]|nr:response regulator [Planctomycetota bacterium]
MAHDPRLILVVDDEAHITHVVALKLTNAGFRVITAGDGEEAFEVALAEKPDLVITDLQMPYMSGLELAKKLRRSAEAASTPVLMLTARGYALDQSELGQTNIRGVMSKPFSPRDVLDHAKAALGLADNSIPEAKAA